MIHFCTRNVYYGYFYSKENTFVGLLKAIESQRITQLVSPFKVLDPQVLKRTYTCSYSSDLRGDVEIQEWPTATNFCDLGQGA